MGVEAEEWPKYRAWYPALLAVLAVAAVLGGKTLFERTRAWTTGEWASLELRPFRLVFYLFVLGSGLIVTFLQPFDMTYFWVTMGAMSALFIIAVALGKLVQRVVPGRVVRLLDLMLFNLCLVVVLLEVGMRVYASVSPNMLLAQFDDSVDEHLAEHRLVPGQLRFGFRCDEHGFYDDPLRERRPGESLVIAIGDSFGVGMVPHYYHYTTVCERILGNMQIYNASVNGAGPPEYLRLIEEVVPGHEPDAVLLGLFVGNDIGAADRGGQSNSALRMWYDRDNVLLYEVPKRLIELANEEQLFADDPGRNRDLPRRELDFDKPGFEAVYKRCFPWLYDYKLEPPTFKATTFWRIESSRAREICGHNPRAYAQLFQQLTAIRETCGKTPLFVVLLPDEFQVEDQLWADISSRNAGLDRDQPQHLVGQWLASQGIPCLDLLPAFRARPRESDGKRHLYLLRDTHFNVRGNEVAGRATARFLREQL